MVSSLREPASALAALRPFSPSIALIRSRSTADPGLKLPWSWSALAGVSHAASNSFPLLMLAGASESFQTNQGAFQEMDQVSFLKGETK